MNVITRFVTSQCAASERAAGLGMTGLARWGLWDGLKARAISGTAWTKVDLGNRLLCTTSGSAPTDKDGDGVGNNKKKRKKERVDSPYVLRRNVYLQKVGALRKEFLKRIEAERAEKERIKKERYQQGFSRAEQRMQLSRYVFSFDPFASICSFSLCSTGQSF